MLEVRGTDERYSDIKILDVVSFAQQVNEKNAMGETTSNLIETEA